MILSGANLLTGLEGELDGHAHVFMADLEMVADRRYTPDRDAPLSTYLDLLTEHGLDGGILVQPSFLGSDNSFLLSALSTRGSQKSPRLRGVVMLDPGTSDSVLRAYDDAGIIGMRLNLFGASALKAFNPGAWVDILRKVDALGWHVELHCEGAYIAEILTHLMQHASRIVIDHFGLPDRTSPANCPGQQAILSSEAGRVFVKTSAPYRVFPQAEQDQAIDLCRPLFKRLVETLGPEQLMWGSDWPWTQFDSRHDFSDTVSWRESLLAG